MYYGSSGVSADKSIFIAMAIIILCLGLVSTAFGNKTELMPDDLIALYEAPIAPGSETRSGDLVEVGQTESIPGDLIVACKTLKMNGKVNGDLLVGGLHLSAGSIANVARDLTMGGYNLRMEGAVGEDARMAGAHVEISGTVDGDLVVFGGNVRISGDVMGDVIAGGGKVNVSGNIQGDLEAGCGEMVIGGVIGQNVVLTASRLVLASTAELKGNLTYTSKRAV